jgi:hypothetical protein
LFNEKARSHPHPHTLTPTPSLQHCLINKTDNYDRTVSELASQTREDLFTAYRNELTNEFKSLADIQKPYHIVAPTPRGKHHTFVL